MKRLKTMLLLMLFAMQLAAQESHKDNTSAASCCPPEPKIEKEKTREEMGGVYYAYPSEEALLTDEGVPKGYHPFYVAHYGRHGSRWMTDDERYLWVIKHFEDKQNLTKLGKSVRRRLAKVWKNAKGNGGKLTPLGARQHRGIAERMMQRLPDVFAGNARVEAHSSTSGRCRNSMLAFTDRMRELNSALRINVVTDPADMSYIAYSSKEAKQLEKATVIVPETTTDRFVKALFKDPEKVENPQKLFTELHTMASDMQDVELKVDLYDLFTDDEFRAVYEANNRRMNICNGNNAANDGIPQLCAISLWRNIEALADKAIEANEPAADLRFGHDTNLMRLMSLMKLNIDSLGMDDVLPMAANLQLVFYRNNRGRILVRMLHNEQPIRMPMMSFGAQYFYRWADVKSFVNNRIHAFEHLRQLNSINTMVGTAAANTSSAGMFGKGSEEHGQTLPAVLSPNGQNFWTPQTQDTEKKCIAPYYYKDTMLQGFRNSHWIVGGCTQDYGSFTVAAISGNLRTQPEQRATRFSHTDEISHPHYYSVRLPDEHLRVEITGASHSALMRITPEKDGPVYVVLNPNSDEDEGFVEIDATQKQIYAANPVHRIYQGWGESAGFSGHFLLKFTDEMGDFGTFTSNSVHEKNLTESHKPRVGAYIRFDGKAGKPITLAMSSSFVDCNGAEQNMQEEIGNRSFDEVKDRLADAWLDRLHRIDVEDDDTMAVNQLYGALYRASFLPRELSDVDGRYPSFGGTKSKPCVTKQSEKPVYTDFSMWDTYRAVHPLYNIICPEMSANMMQSLVNMYEDGGWLPIFPCWNSYTAAMIGDHCAATLADAYVKNVRDFDVEKAYEAMRKNAFEQPKSFEDYRNGMGRRALDSYIRYGFIPLEDSVKEAFHMCEQTSRTLEYAFDDFAVAQMAKALGKNADYEKLISRSENWRNVINPATGYADGRHKNGRFEGNRDYVHRKSYITEGATCHYSWYVPHNPNGLIDVMGGAKRFTEKLDSMFTEGRYWHGNEPCHQVIYMFNFAGKPEKTQKWVRNTLRSEYNDTPGGLSGNDDAGQMSAWYLLSAIGFYPVCPATPYYNIGSPAFKRVVFNLENGKKFTISAPETSRDRIYVESVSIDGKAVNDYRFSHDDIMRGATLQFEMKK